MRKFTQCDANGRPVQVLEFSSPPVVEYLGLPDGHTLTEGVIEPPAPSPSDQAADAAAAAWLETKQIRSSKEYGGFLWNGCRFDSTIESQARIYAVAMRAVLAIQRGETFTETWTLQDNTTRDFTAVEWVDIGEALALHVAEVHRWARSRRPTTPGAPTPPPAPSPP